MTNARKLAGLPSGGTNCSAPLRHLNEQKLTGDLVIYVSDNESWMDSKGWQLGRSTGTMTERQEVKRRSPRTKLVCLDIQPHTPTQAPDRGDILNIGGLADTAFQVIAGVNSSPPRPD